MTNEWFKVQWVGANTGSSFSALVRTQEEVAEIANRRTAKNVVVTKVAVREISVFGIKSFVEDDRLFRELGQLVEKVSK